MDAEWVICSVKNGVKLSTALRKLSPFGCLHFVWFVLAIGGPFVDRQAVGSSRHGSADWKPARTPAYDISEW